MTMIVEEDEKNVMPTKRFFQTLAVGRPNTYTFTKALAEIVVKENCGDVPAVIVRPSIVTPSILEPKQGWVDSWNGATGFLFVISKGFCRSLQGNKNGVLDFIPVDYVSNFIVVAAAKCQGCKELKVFNCCSSSINPIEMGDISDKFTKHFARNGYNDLPMPFCVMTQYRWLVNIIIFFLEILPAYLTDFCLYLFGKPTKFIKIQAQVAQIRKAQEYFTNNFWNIKMTRSLKIISQLSKEDSRIFPCNPEDISWQEYVGIFCEGVRKYLDKGKK